MENTDKVLFDDKNPEWYVASGNRWVGPLTAHDVYIRIQSGELSLANYVWRKGQDGWMRVCDIESFNAALPQSPHQKLQVEIEKSAAPEVKKSVVKKSNKVLASTPRIWFLYYNDSQFGPFTESEVKLYLTTGKLHGKVYCWKEEMDSWVRISKVSNFKEEVKVAEKVREKKKKIPPASEGSSDQRSSDRKPLVAKIILTDDNTVVSAVCRDISVGGMQVLTDHIPGPTGTELRLNVSPSGDLGDLEPFVAEGVIVRILEDGRGFSFRFNDLPENAKDLINRYINEYE